ncbi:hypothetical protein V6N12_016579 [Hibiscus sabdariffa]|uniref:Transmembrane protein n=1 Tax=Hibiscus sabdariffa TaxID=183260 RepID=A0ABR2CEG1_9ROSI
MGEEREDGDPQKLKGIAAAAYDYDNDPRWADYWSNILIPPHMASRSDVVDHFKRKFYQRYIDPDLVVEAMPSSKPSQSAKPSASSSTSSAAAADGVRPHNAGSPTRSSGASAAAGSNTSSVRWDRQTLQFSVNAWVFMVAVLSIFPLYPISPSFISLSYSAYQLSFVGTACSCLYSLYAVEGYDELVWIFIAAALIPILCRTLEHITKFLRRNFNRSTFYRKYLEDPCVWVESNKTTINIISSKAEIGVGFFLIVFLLSWQCNIIQTFTYWQLLKFMYHAPVSAEYHQSIWANIGTTVNPLVQRHAPFLNTPVSAIQRWWFQ